MYFLVYFFFFFWRLLPGHDFIVLTLKVKEMFKISEVFEASKKENF